MLMYYSKVYKSSSFVLVLLNGGSVLSLPSRDATIFQLSEQVITVE